MSTTTDLLAAILICFALIKLFILIFNAPVWIAFAKAVYSHPVWVQAISLSLAGIVLAALLLADITVVEILAIALLVALLISAGMAPYAPAAIAWVEKEDIVRVLRQQALYVAFWMVLLLVGAIDLMTR